MTIKSPSFAFDKKDEVKCEICGNNTPYIGTKRCDYCWEMEKGLRNFIRIDKNKAKEWLKDRLKELGE